MRSKLLSHNSFYKIGRLRELCDGSLCVCVCVAMEEIRKEIDVGDWHSNLAFDEWTPLTVAAGSRASARYKVKFDWYTKHLIQLRLFCLLNRFFSVMEKNAACGSGC